MNGSILSRILGNTADDAAEAVTPQLISDFLPRAAAGESGVLGGLLPRNRGTSINVKHIAPAASDDAMMNVNGDAVPILDISGPSKASPATAKLESDINSRGTGMGNREWIDTYVDNMTDRDGTISKNGISINTDDAREMIKAVIDNPDILAHSPEATQLMASRLRRMVTRDMVNKSRQNPRNFTFLGGGPGFGKGSAAKNLRKAGTIVVPDNSVIFDETLKDTGALDDWLEQILNANPDNTVGLSLVMGNPAESYPRTISRSIEGMIKGTSKRTVPLEYAAGAYNSYYDSALKALDMFPRDRGRINMMDNRVAFGQTPEFIDNDYARIRAMLESGQRTSVDELRGIVDNAIQRGVPIYDKEARQIIASGKLPEGIDVINRGDAYDLIKLPQEILEGIDSRFKTGAR